MTDIATLVREAKLWAKYPEHWVLSGPEKVCVDGEQLVFERVNLQGYRFSEANAQCTAPPVVRDLALAIIVASGETELAGLLQ